MSWTQQGPLNTRLRDMALQAPVDTCTTCHTLFTMFVVPLKVLQHCSLYSTDAGDLSVVHLKLHTTSDRPEANIDEFGNCAAIMAPSRQSYLTPARNTDHFTN